MRIAELKSHHDACLEHDRMIRAMVARAAFPQVFELCTASFPHIIPAIRFRKKRDLAPQVPDLAAFTTIFRYAPPLFEHALLSSLHELIESSRVLSQSETRFLDCAEAAREGERIALRIWNYLESHPHATEGQVCSSCGVDGDAVLEIIGIWSELGILKRSLDSGAPRLRFSTRLDTQATGVCAQCGARGTGRKDVFFRSVTCQKCRAVGFYHIQYEGFP